MKRLFWKFRYARHLKRHLGLTMRAALQNAEAALENIDNDLSEDPIDSANDEISLWAADS